MSNLYHRTSQVRDRSKTMHQLVPPIIAHNPRSLARRDRFPPTADALTTMLNRFLSSSSTYHAAPAPPAADPGNQPYGHFQRSMAPDVGFGDVESTACAFKVSSNSTYVGSSSGGAPHPPHFVQKQKLAHRVAIIGDPYVYTSSALFLRLAASAVVALNCSTRRLSLRSATVLTSPSPSLTSVSPCSWPLQLHHGRRCRQTGVDLGCQERSPLVTATLLLRTV
jgi:hypothetical protein